MERNLLKGFLALFVCAISMAFSLGVSAQSTVSGRVSDGEGVGVPGVSIVIMGTAQGAVTDIDGNYSMELPAGSVKLMFSYIGMLTQEVDVDGKTTIDVVMQADVIGVDEVVVVGYGTQQKKTVTGAVSSVGAEDLRAVPVANAAARLQGRVSGVTIVSDNSPGGDATVRVRGYGTINNNDPLFVIDGVPTTGGLSKINPNDIESMTVLKDASSSAIYGVRAANGVIIITTKRGKSGAPRVTFDARYGVQKATNSMDLMNTQEYGEMLFMEMRNKGLSPGDTGWGTSQYGNGATPVIPMYCKPVATSVDESSYSFPDNTIYKASPGTDWYDEIFDAAPIQEYNISVSGGTDKGNYAFSTGYMNQEGIVINTGFERYAARMNADVKIADWLEIGESIGVTYTDRVGIENNREGNAISQAYRMQPIIPVYDIQGNYAGTKAPGTGNGANPVAVLDRDKDDNHREMRILGNAYVKVHLMEGLSVKTLFGVNYESQRWRDRFLQNPEFAEAKPTDKLTENYAGGIQYNWANTLNYTKTFADNHKLDVMAGVEAVNNNWDYFNAGRTTYFATDLDYMVLDAGESDQSSGGSFDEWATFSYFARANYSYADKYLFEAVVRRDASSRFSEDNRWGTFPAFSAGWRISEESFMDDSRDWLDDLKLRVGYGQLGNDQVGNYNVYSTYRANINESFYDINGSGSSTQSGFHKYKLGNPDAKWETTSTTNIGVDATMLNNLFEVNVDWYTKTTSDMLYPASKPNTWGQLQFPNVNIGEMKNTGWDFMLTYHGTITKDFTVDVRANISHYKNEVVKLNDNSDEILYGTSLRENVYTATTTGQPISSFYGYVVEGIFQSNADVQSHVPFNAESFENDVYSKPGVFKYKDVNKDGKITADDRDFIGSPHPDFTYGLNIDLNYKNWDMTMFFSGSKGNDLINYVNRWTLFTNFQGNRDPDRLYKSWGSPYLSDNADATLPIALQDDSQMQKNSSFFVEDGSYFRMKDLQLGYTLPKSITSKAGIGSLRVYGQVTNLFTISDYSGLDPEIRTGRSDQIFGVDEGSYPTPRMIMFGVSLNL